jgi:ribosomal protein L28
MRKNPSKLIKQSDGTVIGNKKYLQKGNTISQSQGKDDQKRRFKSNFMAKAEQKRQ